MSERRDQRADPRYVATAELHRRAREITLRHDAARPPGMNLAEGAALSKAATQFALAFATSRR